MDASTQPSAQGFIARLASLKSQLKFHLKSSSSLVLVAGLLVVAIGSYILGHFSAPYFPSVAFVCSILSGAGCGISWLLSRELFRPKEQRAIWPALLVVVLFTFVAFLVIAKQLGFATEAGAFSFLHKVVVMISSTALLMPLVEAGTGLSSITDTIERKFRIRFIGIYVLVLLAVIILGLPKWSVWQEKLVVALAVLALTGYLVAVRFRLNNPLVSPVIKRVRTKAVDVEVSAELIDKIKNHMSQQKPYLDHQLKVAALAEQLSEQEYKVTQAITMGLGFRNFNHLVNSYRIEHAKELLRSAEHAKLPILSIALESGFASVGPFNRAFKELVELTDLASLESRRVNPL